MGEAPAHELVVLEELWRVVGDRGAVCSVRMLQRLSPAVGRMARRQVRFDLAYLVQRGLVWSRLSQVEVFGLTAAGVAFMLGGEHVLESHLTRTGLGVDAERVATGPDRDPAPPTSSTSRDR